MSETELFPFHIKDEKIEERVVCAEFSVQVYEKHLRNFLWLACVLLNPEALLDIYMRGEGLVSAK